MPFGPQLSDVPRIRKALAVFKVSSVLTGTFLLLLCLMMVFRYGFFVDIELGGASGFLGLTAKEDITGINLSTILLMVHGWFYVLYVAVDFVLWRLMRWSFGRFLFVALGGIIPLLSYYFERTIPRSVNSELARLEASADAAASTGAASEVSA